jgi:hypothetical protein
MAHPPRLQLFEVNDSRWAPGPLRDALVESLSRTLRWGGMLRGLVGPFREFLARSGATEVLDLCSGAGGPARILVDELERAGATPPRFVLTDLHPQVEAWRAARAEHPGVIDFEPGPVDATRIPDGVARGRARVVINAFHHFPPATAGALLADAVAGATGVFIAETFDRNPLRFLTFGPAGLPALAADPILAARDRAARALLAWLTPIALAASAWDGVVSTLRVYTEAELRELAAPHADRWSWEHRTFGYVPFGRGYCFFGTPRRAR